MKKILLSIAAAMSLCTASYAQLSKNNTCKFLGNITTRGSIPDDYATMWEQLTPENETKWGSIANKEVQSVEQALSSWNWGPADREYNWCKQHGVQFKFHCLLWTSQYPSYLANYTGDRLRKQIDIWFEAVSRKYPDLTIIDVVNEAIPGHAEGDNNGQAKTFKTNLSQAMSGSTNPGDYKWITEAFKMARKWFPNAVLIYNDYNTFQWQRNEFVDLVSTLVKQGAPIDAYGHQSHDLNDMGGADFKSRLYSIHDDITKKAGRELACYLTEYDIAKQGDNGQKTRYSEQIPTAWEADFVAGITLWGYVHGATWVDDSGLIKNGQDRPAMTWLRQYMASDAAKNASCRLLCGKAAGGPSLKFSASESAIELGESVTLTAELDGANEFTYSVGGEQIGTGSKFVWTPEKAGSYEIKVETTLKGEKISKAVTVKVVKVGPYGGTAAVIPGTIECENYDEGYSGKTFYDKSEGNVCDDFKNAYRSDDVDIKEITGGYAVGHCQSGEWLRYTVDVKEDGEYAVSMRLGEGNADGKLTIEIDGQKQDATIEGTGEWGSFAVVKLDDMTLTKGTKELKITINQDWIDLDWIKFECKDCKGEETGSVGMNENARLAIYPNPAKDVIKIANVYGDYTVDIYTTSGTLVKSANTDEISVADLENGIYIVKVVSENETKTAKVVVEK